MTSEYTYFDTVEPYHCGCGEIAFLETVVKRYPRSSYTITDKQSLFMSSEDIPGFFEA